jgi:hypothetical protein
VISLAALIGAISLAEPAVALSDFALSLIAAACAVAMLRDSGGSQDAATLRWFAGFFAVLAASALLGGLDHGFFRTADGMSLGHAIAWPVTLALIGAAGAVAAVIAARLSLPPRAARIATAAAGILLIAHIGRIALGERQFSAAIAAYLLPAVWLLGVLIWRGLRRATPGALRAATGVALILAGSAVQHFDIGVGDGWLGPNTLYHVAAAAGLVLLATGARALIAATPVLDGQSAAA